MWRRRSLKFYLGFPPSGFYFHGLRALPNKSEYLKILQDYKKDLEDELREVEKEIEQVQESQE